MEKQPGLNLLKVAGGISTFSGIGHGLFYLFNKLKGNDEDSIKLSPWLESFIEEVEFKLKKSKDKLYNKATIASVINLLSELEEYLYLKDCQKLEEKRIKLIEYPQKYESAVFESLEQHEKYFEIAKNLLTKRIRINFDTILKCVNNYNVKEFKIILDENQKEYDDLPRIDKDVVKRAFIAYLNQQKQHEKASEKLFKKAGDNSDYQNVAMGIQNMNKYLLKDMIYREYGINEKYFYQLLKKNGLFSDAEIINKLEIDKDLTNKFR